MQTIRYLVLALALVACSTLARAQNLPPLSANTALGAQDAGACVTAGAYASWSVPAVSAIAFNVSGTYSGTLTFYGQVNGAWISLLVSNLSTGAQGTTTTTTGNFSTPNPGLTAVCVSFTTKSSGTPVVIATQGYGVSRLAPVAPAFPASFTAGDLLYANAATTVTGLADVATGQVLASGGVGAAPAYTASPTLTSVSLSGTVGWNADTFLTRDAANTIAQVNGATAQASRIYNTFTDASNYERGLVGWSSNQFIVGTQQAGAGTSRVMRFQTASTNWWELETTGHLFAVTDNQVDIGGATHRPRSLYLAAPAITSGTDDVTVTVSDVTRTRYQATITPSGGVDCNAAFKAAALTADCNVATIPAGQRLVAVYADVTAGFTCSGTCSGTKVVQCGSSAGATDILAAGFNVAVTGTAGLTDAQLGSAMVRAAAIQGGFLGSWSTTTPVSCRFTSGTGNWGNATVTFVNAGSVKFTLITEQIK